MSMEQEGYVAEEETTEEPTAEVPEAPDYLAGLDDEVRARIEAAMAAQTSAAATEAEKAAEHRFRSAMGKYGRATQQMAEIGLLIDETGSLGVSDPERLGALAGRYGHGAPAAQEPVAAEDPYAVDDYDTPAEAARKTREAMKKDFSEALAAQQKAFETQTNSLLRAVGQTRMPTAADTARPFLDELGMGHLAETPEFKRAFENALQNVPMESWGDPLTIETAAGMALPYARRAYAEQGGAAPARGADNLAERRTQAALASEQANRGGANLIAPSRGIGSGQRAQPVYTEDDRAVMATAKAMGMDWTPEKLAAALDKPTSQSDGHSAYHDYLETEKKKARR